ncbi:MAG: hypothetical protein R3297_06610, partial [Desulfobulbales bacterium]|nr:hypothetical protein [Desulfobulbales bacterium]
MRASSAGIAVLTSDHKFPPGENRLSEVRRQIIASYRPAPADRAVLLNRSAATKRRPARLTRISDNSLRQKLSARSAIV